MESIGMPEITMSIGYQWFRIPMPEITMPEITMDTSDRQLPVVQTNPHTPLPKPGRATEVGELLHFTAHFTARDLHAS